MYIIFTCNTRCKPSSVHLPWRMMMNTVWSGELILRVAMFFISPAFRIGILKTTTATNKYFPSISITYLTFSNSSTIDELGQWCLVRVKPSRMQRVVFYMFLKVHNMVRHAAGTLFTQSWTQANVARACCNDLCVLTRFLAHARELVSLHFLESFVILFLFQFSVPFLNLHSTR